jgi:enoyl-CoA hydratase/carnithine racemase
MLDTVAAFRELDNHPDTIFTVLTGEGRFFSAGADVKAVSSQDTPTFSNDAEKKVHFLSRFAAGKFPHSYAARQIYHVHVPNLVIQPSN